jgi:cytochrome P450
MQSIYDIPKVPGLPFLGSAPSLFDNREKYYWKYFCKHGSIFRTEAIGQQVIFFGDPDFAKSILQDQSDKFSSQIGWSYFEPLFGKGILLLDGEPHRKIKKLMFPAFHTQAITSYFSAIADIINKYLPDLSSSDFIHLAVFFRNLMLTISCRLFLGIQSQEHVRQASKWFLNFFLGQLTILRLDHPITKFGRALQARRNLESFIQTTIDEKRKYPNPSFNDVLDLLMHSYDENNDQLSDQEIIRQTLQLLIAGHETTSRVMCWLLYELAGNPTWTTLLQNEINLQLGSQSLSPSNLKNFSLIEYTLREIERLYPPIYGIPRGALEDVEIQDLLIPAGWRVSVSPLLIHRLPSLYTNPHKFDPMRFAPPREEHKNHPFAFFPFGAGAHRCLGNELAQMEMKIILITLLRNFNWSIKPSYTPCLPVRNATKDEQKLMATFTPF